MQISNFRSFVQRGTTLNNWEHATVDVTTGFWLWRKTTAREVHRTVTGNWRWFDSGELTPGYQVEQLDSAYKAKLEFENAKDH